MDLYYRDKSILSKYEIINNGYKRSILNNRRLALILIDISSERIKIIIADVTFYEIINIAWNEKWYFYINKDAFR